MNTGKKIIFALLGIVCLVFIFSFRAYAAQADTARYEGKDRYDTAVNVSRENFTHADCVIVVSGEDFADALSSTALAGKNKAPILLSQKNRLDDDVISEIERLGAKNAIIVGGEGAISNAVRNQLEKINVLVTRIGGHDRYDTSVQVAKSIGISNGIAIASGENFADALSMAPVAGARQIPIILTSSKTLSDSAKQFIDQNRGKRLYIIGGEGAVSSSIEGYIGDCERFAGINRYETNTAVIKAFLNKGYINMDTVYVASGSGFPDALSGSAAAAQTSSPIVIVNNNSINQQNIVKSNISSVTSIKIIGGKGAVSDAAVQRLINGTNIVVTLDPGHGGYDPGAVGYGGTMEKNITLPVALKIGKIIQQSGINVVYTRTSDRVSWPSNVSEDLQKRCEISDAAGSDYFVSIHMNSAGAEARGTETYYYSSSKEGRELAQYIQSSLVQAIASVDRGIKTANYYVIKNTAAPAVLVEVGFISNPQEERLLNSDDFQNKVASGIAKGIVQKIQQDN
ncbi:MAG: cell wall-binding repeat-containing protein [Clostridium sp.]|jgi:N-acetylmuramoyl-L-alanine amidase|uniref:cell wall-binding repeat-containing protein n=1 Tax=Clostridium sp. TaxID=1506 RepID=UPI0025BC1E68|nr:cell wall-binding repeat-containing protein [Clostridium sp.]MCH3964768.1 cell wall-binding repeat-containing protein [Clostridium sp.]MCI1715239.1 cell wall-binding repeat-containing protein [Clostridium sp.]MCI1799501.1 cell wall-binding repeat-containing protein [Clostridium sp.]MCI1813422.1 cell wall-binding repeat-containing protein [Clostridium sp.]MCI1870313.1 cell wall-binding repeat-containing protein [Clostridium sp.]